MDLSTLEYPKILERLAKRCSFSASVELARGLQPTSDLETARRWQAETTEARRLLDTHPQITTGGARDVRQHAQAAARGVVLPIPDILAIKATLIAARTLARTFDRLGTQFPYLTEIATRIPPPLGLIDAITQAISERGDIHDNASPRLAQIRRDLRTVHDRLLHRMQRMLSDPKIAPYLQDTLVTQRDGRYVLPLRADFKGKIKAIVHDQSASGATLFVEPLSVVEANNQYRQLQLDERDEERRILAELCSKIAARAAELETTVQTLAQLDLIFARARLAEDMHATEPILKPLPPKASDRPRPGTHPGSVIRLQGARHPLLDPDTVVPIDILLDPNTYALIITGPNTGGKTVSLKTVGLLALMAQSGLHIPADPGSQISVFEAVYADIGDEQSIEQSLSTFSAHITNIIRILKQATPRALVLLDELGSGTDPQEGAALASAILTYLLDRGITTLVATHYPELKTYALAREGVLNASVEFDIETLRPTYHLIIGLPGASNALTIAQRLGLPEEIVQLARRGISPEELRAEDLLTEIHQQRDLIRRARRDAEKARIEAEKLRAELAARLGAIEDERRDILERARQQAEDRLASLEEELRKLRRQLARARQPLEVVEEVAAEVERLEDELSTPIERTPLSQEVQTFDLPPAPIRLGDKVKLRSLGSQGVVTALDDEEAEVQIGILRVRTRLSELLPLSGQPASGIQPPPTHPPPASLPQMPSAPGIELDLRGLRVDEALEKLDDYLEAASLADLPWARIIHGKGTGRLRQAVRKALRNNPHVQSFEPGKRGEGGEGVTVVKFR